MGSKNKVRGQTETHDLEVMKGTERYETEMRQMAEAGHSSTQRGLGEEER